MQSIIRQLRATPNRGIEHVFLGDPRSTGADKTCVEPGNIYSPGIWTCGVSLCLLDCEIAHSPLALDESAMQWGFEVTPRFAPILTARYTLDRISVTHRITHRGTEGTQGVDYNEVSLTCDTRRELRMGVFVRDIGPAGGAITNLTWDGARSTLTVDEGLQLVLEQDCAACEIVPSGDGFDCPCAVVHVPVVLTPATAVTIRFRTHHNYLNHQFSNDLRAVSRPNRVTTTAALARAPREWRNSVPASIETPDPRINAAWDTCAHHMLAAMECSLPRIGAVNYPIFWMRDGVIIVRALDLMGRHDLARTACEHIAPVMFSGGFGAESDAPGEVIWALVSHGMLSGDRSWLRRMLPHIEQRVELIDRMRTAKVPLYAVADNRTALVTSAAFSTLLCLPAQHGLIHGRMDMHSPDFFINCWSAAGYRFAAKAARACGKLTLARTWASEGESLERAIARHLLPHYGNDRDPIITPYPSESLPGARDSLCEHFARWYRSRRLTDAGTRRPEPEWTYFEAAQIHNAVLLGLVDEAWVNLDGMLTQENGRGVFAFIEGPAGRGEYLPFRNDIGGRGWLDRTRARGGNMPHNWTTGEMVTLIRDMIAHEDGTELVLGAGVPSSWRAEGKTLRAHHLPTSLGQLDFEARFDSAGTPVMTRYRGPKRWRWSDHLLTRQ